MRRWLTAPSDSTTSHNELVHPKRKCYTFGIAASYGVRRQNEVATPLWLLAKVHPRSSRPSDSAKAVSPLADSLCHRTPQKRGFTEYLLLSRRVQQARCSLPTGYKRSGRPPQGLG